MQQDQPAADPHSSDTEPALGFRLAGVGLKSDLAM